MGGFKFSPEWNTGYQVVPMDTDKMADAVHVGYNMAHDYSHLSGNRGNATTNAPPTYATNMKRKGSSPFSSGPGSVKRMKLGQRTRFRKGSYSKSKSEKKKKQKKSSKKYSNHGNKIIIIISQQITISATPNKYTLSIKKS